MKKTIDISSDLIYDLIKLLDIFVLEMIDMKLKNLKNMREAAGLTQKQASEKIGVGQSAVSMWETGDSSPRAEMLPIIAAVYNCQIGELF